MTEKHSSIEPAILHLTEAEELPAYVVDIKTEAIEREKVRMIQEAYANVPEEVMSKAAKDSLLSRRYEETIDSYANRTLRVLQSRWADLEKTNSDITHDLFEIEDPSGRMLLLSVAGEISDALNAFFVPEDPAIQLTKPEKEQLKYLIWSFLRSNQEIRTRLLVAFGARDRGTTIGDIISAQELAQLMDYLLEIPVETLQFVSTKENNSRTFILWKEMVTRRRRAAITSLKNKLTVSSDVLDRKEEDLLRRRLPKLGLASVGTPGFLPELSAEFRKKAGWAYNNNVLMEQIQVPQLNDEEIWDRVQKKYEVAMRIELTDDLYAAWHFVDLSNARNFNASDRRSFSSQLPGQVNLEYIGGNFAYLRDQLEHMKEQNRYGDILTDLIVMRRELDTYITKLQAAQITYQAETNTSADPQVPTEYDVIKNNLNDHLTSVQSLRDSVVEKAQTIISSIRELINRIKQSHSTALSLDDLLGQLGVQGMHLEDDGEMPGVDDAEEDASRGVSDMVEKTKRLTAE